MDMEMCQDVVEESLESSYASDSDCDWQCTIDNIFSDFKNPDGRGQLFARPEKLADISIKELNVVFSLVSENVSRADLNTRAKAPKLQIVLTPMLQAINDLLTSIDSIVEDEKEFRVSIVKLASHLQEFCSVPLESVRKLTISSAFIGFQVAIDNATFASAQFLEGLSAVEKLKPSQSGPNITLDTYLPPVTQILTALCTHIDKFMPTFSRFHFIIRYAQPLCQLYNDFRAADPDFERFMNRVELQAEANLTYMINIPVQKLGRFEQHCRQIYDNILSCKAIVQEEYWEIFCSMEVRAERILKAVRNEMLKCFNEVSAWRDLERLHHLYERYALGGVGFDMGSVVNSKRIIIREGMLRRHHRHVRRQRVTDGSFRYSLIHVFSDILLVSADVLPSVKSNSTPANSEPTASKFDDNVSTMTTNVKPFSSEAAPVAGIGGPPNRARETSETTGQQSLASSQTNGLRLQCIVPLFKGCGTVCLALPSMLSNTESSWFVVISKRKALYLCANSVSERDDWVRDINRVLKINSADNDTYRTITRASLVNTLIGEIQTHLNQQKRKKSGEKGSGSDSGGVDVPLSQQSQIQQQQVLQALGHGTKDRVKVGSKKGLSQSQWIICKEKNVFLIQPRWWHMYDVLIDIVKVAASDGESSSTTESTAATKKSCAHLRQVIDYHAEEVYESLLSVCDVEASRICVSDALLNCASGWVSTITSNPHTQHLIAMGWFFERGIASTSSSLSTSSSSSNTGGNITGKRPTALQVFLFSHVLLVMEARCNPSGTSEFELSYLYHIEMKHLQCRHYEWSNKKASEDRSADPSASSSIMLIDTSSSNSRRISLTSLLSSGAPRLQKVIYAPTTRAKVSWMRLINETIGAYKVQADSGAFDDNVAVQVLRDAPLYRVCAPVELNGLWATEEPGERAARKKHQEARNSSAK
jgi:hypothetical protein